MNKTAIAMLAAVAAGICLPAQAQETSSFRFSGFGTIGAVMSDRDDVQFVASRTQSNGATTSPNMGVDSRIAAQVDYRLNETFSAVGQVLASRRNGTETPRLEWLFGQAEVGGGVALRAGRMVLPAFLLSDVRAVGFAQHWVRPPSEVYALYPSTSFDGGQLQWRPRFGNTNITAQVSYGQAQPGRYYAGGLNAYMEFKQLRSVNLIAENGNWTARFGASQARVTLSQPGIGILADVIDRFVGGALQYDDGNWLMVSELVTRQQNKGGPFGSKSFYVTSGYRFGAWMPYLTYAEFYGKGASYRTQPTGRTTALGLRWDAMNKLAIKAQLENATPSSQILSKVRTSTTYDRINALSVTADFVF